MDASQAKSQLLDLPNPFTRTGVAFDSIISSQAASLGLYTFGSDTSSGSISVSGASDGWLSAWGEIFDVQRAPSEGNVRFSDRIRFTLQSPVGTVSAIETFVKFILGVSVIVTEYAGAPGYEISIPASVSNSSIDSFLKFLSRIRPAGVPFNVVLQTNPLILTSYSYVGSSGFAGAYLGYGTEAYSFTLGASTVNAVPQAPDQLLTDPLLNGQVSLGFVS